MKYPSEENPREWPLTGAEISCTSFPNITQYIGEDTELNTYYENET
jgi:hypothetical protein